VVVEHQVEELYSLLVPLNQARLIVPRSCVEEVVRYASPEEEDSGPAWFRGFISWNGLRVPIVRFEELCGLTAPVPGGRTRVAIFHGLAGLVADGVFGVLTEGFPQLVRVNREVMQVHDEHAWPDDGPVICQIKMINEYPLIPDLEKIESMVQEYLSTGS
jgi:chemosensory pili system protein ChpC